MASLTKTVLVGVDDRGDAVAQPELGENRTDMSLHRDFGNYQFGCDLGIGKAAGDEQQDFSFSWGHRRLVGRRTADGGRFVGKVPGEGIEQEPG